MSILVNAVTCDVSVPTMPIRISAAVAARAIMPSSARVFITRHCTLGNCGRLLDTSLEISTPLKYVNGVGPKRAEMLETKALLTVEDLLGYAPFRYEDRSNVKTIAQLAPGEVATVLAEVTSAKLAGFRRRSL